MKKTLKISLICGLTLLSNVAIGGTIDDSFNSGSTLTAAHLTNIKTAVNDNDARLAALEASLLSLQTDLATAQSDLATTQTDLASANSTIAELNTQLDTNTGDISGINSSSVMALDPFLTIDTTDNATAILSAINLQIVNGLNVTDSTNGVGNLIVGYDEVSTGTLKACSRGNYATRTTCEDAGEIWSNSHKTGSHNLVLGSQNSYSSYGGLVTGYRNFINGIYTSVTGGTSNIARGTLSSVGGGANNISSVDLSVVSGGSNNHADGQYSTVSGGSTNTATGLFSIVSGGTLNEATGNFSTVSGGSENTASGPFSTVSGGSENSARGYSSTVGGGQLRSAINNFDWVAGTLFEDD